MKNGIINGIKATLLIIAATIFISCGNLPGEIDITDGYGGVFLSLEATAPASSAPVLSTMRASGDPLVLPVTDTAGAQIGVLTLTDARFILHEIELEQDSSEIDTVLEQQQELEIEFEGPFLVDLLNETVVPDIPYTELLPGVYTELELKLEEFVADDWVESGSQLIELSDPLYGNSVYLAGTYTGDTSDGDDAAVNVDFSISLNIDEEFESDISGLADGIVIDEGEINSIIVAFRMAKWLKFDNSATNPGDIDFDSLVVEAGGTEIILDGTTNSDLLNVILLNIKESADYGEDEDSSGHLESDEDDDPDSEDGDDD